MAVLHFDVLIDDRDKARVTRYANDWLADRGLPDADIDQSLCQFCRSEPANPEVAAAIARQGYFIIELEGARRHAMTTYKPLDCDLHDYLEIACMHHYDLQIELIDGPDFTARALTTRTSAIKEEFVVLAANVAQREVRLDQLTAITPLDRSARFSRIELGERYCRY